MTITLRRDPNRTHDRRYYECRDCGARTMATAYRAACPECGERLRNIAVPRE